MAVDKKIRKAVLKNNGWLGLKSPIFWRITAGVFISILLIEAALLVFSWFTERDRLLGRLDESLVTVTSLLDPDQPVPQLDKLLESQSSASNKTNFKITGYVYQSPSGIQYSNGDVAALTDAVNKQSDNLYQGSDDTYAKYIERSLQGQPTDKLYFRVDTSGISAYMKDYIVRILGMVVLISLFVTGACLVFMTPLLIRPLQRLNALLVQGEKHGLGKARAQTHDLRRKDEIGSVFRSFSKLRKELVAAEEKNIFINKRFEELAGLGADCFWEVDKNTVFTYVAGDFSRLLDCEPESMIGTSVEDFLAGLSESLPTGDSISESLAKNGTWEGKIISPDPGIKHCTVRVAASPFYDRNGEFAGVRGTIVDMSKETELANTLRYQATHDELTGLVNRRELTDRVNDSIEGFLSEGTVFTLLTLDLDRFKAINDSCGHVAGDMLLKGIALKLKASVRKSDTVARIGGDEFAILLESANANDAKKIAETLRKSIEEYRLVWEGDHHSVSASIGLAEVSEELCCLESLTFASDSSCISAKDNGKNQIRVYSSESDLLSSNRDESTWLTRINNALEEDTFELYSHSIVRVDSTEEKHFEILLRMQDGEGGFYPPNLFLPTAERNSLMPQIDRWVVSNALKWLSHQTIAAEQNYCMNINLSAASLTDEGFRQFLVEIIENSEELNKYVCYEITESAAMLNPDETIELLTCIRSHGCRVALDDFGTGFSSLSQIRTLPLDYIKIDGMFIREIHNNELDQALVRSVAEIAKVLNIKTVAEFVDNEDALALLGILDIDYAQGYLISKPQSLADMELSDLGAKAA